MTTDGWRSWAAPTLLILVAGLYYESLFLHYGLNRLDESWQLYVAMQMKAGRTLYDDALWVFPPAHVWTGVVAHWLDPPGIVLSRGIYGAFCVALSISTYFVMRRVTSAPFALLAALLVTFSAPRSHNYQLLFGFRYLVLCMIALLCFDQRLRGGRPGWMFAAGAWIGLAVTFRLTPAFSASCGIAIALLATGRSLRGVIQDGLRFTAGLALVAAPTLAYFATTVGLDTLFEEVVVHPLAMLQALPPPDLEWPKEWTRSKIVNTFIALQFRLIWAFYGLYLLGLAVAWVRARRAGEPFRHGLLTALTVLGAVFFVRSTGRSDFPHLDSVIPPVCMLFAHATSLLHARLPGRGERTAGAARATAWGLCAAVLATWMFLLQTDRIFDAEYRGNLPVTSLDGATRLLRQREILDIDHTIERIRSYSRPDDRILDLSASPLLHVVTGRFGPGFRDIIMPGTFLDAEEEARFIALLEAEPPVLVVWPARPFDDMPSRSVHQTAPEVTRWVLERYERLPPPAELRRAKRRWDVMLPRSSELRRERTEPLF